MTSRRARRPKVRAPRADVAAVRAGSPWLAMIVLVLGTWAIFGAALGHDFVWDDREHIVNNALVREWSGANLASFWRAPYLGLWMPVIYNALSAVAQLAVTPPSAANPAGLDAAWFHALNLVLHSAAVSIVFVVLRRFAKDVWAAFLGAALFAWHPLQVEPVVWVSGIKDLLSSTLALAALALHLAPDGEQPTSPRRWPRELVATLLFGLALASKPAVVTLPFVAWALRVGVQRRPWREGIGWLALWLGLAASVAVLTTVAHQDATTAHPPPLWARPLIAADALTFYLSKLFWPVNLGPMHGRTPEVVMGGSAIGWSWLPPLVLAGLAMRASARAWLTPAVAISVVALVPVLGLVPFRFQFYSTVADRYFYLAMLGPALALALGLPRGSSGTIPVPVRAAALGVLVMLAALSHRQTQVWNDNLSLWTHAVAVKPDAALAQHNLGHFLARAGRGVEAEAPLRRAIELSPRYANAMNSLGNLLLDRGDAQAAIPHYRDAQAITPEDGRIAYNLGNAYSQIGDFDAAARQYVAAMASTPRYRDDYRALYGLGVARLEQGNYAEAVQYLSRTVHLEPGFTEARVRLDEARARIETPAGSE